jgi:hypothetical protein
MFISNRPLVNKDQLADLKVEIKLLSRLIVSELKTSKNAKYNATSTQNSYARKFGFDSFSEMTYLCVAETQHQDFGIENVLSADALYEIYSSLSHKGTSAELLSVGHINNALVEFKSRKNAPTSPTISLELLREIINESEYSEHHYTETCGFPSEFKIEPTSEFFDNVFNGDHIVITDGDKKKSFTITEFEHIYSKKKVFKVISGRWWNIDTSPFCTGQD